MRALIPQSFIDELLQRTDLVELIDGYVPLTKKGNSYVACCPFHNEKSPSFNVVAKKQFYHCFGCHESGNAISFLMRFLNVNFVEAIKTLATRLNLSIPGSEGEQKPKSTAALNQLLKEVNHYYQHQLQENREAQDYIAKRGVDRETTQLYELGYAPEGWHTLEPLFKKHQKELIESGMLIQKEDGKTYDRYRHRITFPIHDQQGRIIGFGGRALDANQPPKYLNSPETVLFQKNRHLYGLYQVLNREKKSPPYIIVVEGYLDVIALAQYGIGNVVATLGTATSSYHIQLLAKHTKQLLFCFDGDRAGQQAAWRALENSLPYLHEGLEVGFIFLPEGQDPDSFVRLEGKERFSEILKTPTLLHQFFFNTLSLGINLATPAGKTQLILRAKPHLLKIPDGFYKQLMLDYLARLTHIESQRLHYLLQEKNEVLLVKKTPFITRTPLKIAMALLLQHPEIIPPNMHTFELNDPEDEDFPLLQTLITNITESNNATTATLIESWRNTPYFEYMTQLATWDTQVPELEQAQEFTDTLLFLQKQHQDKQIQALITKSRLQGLDTNERMQLQNMLQKRHKPI